MQSTEIHHCTECDAHFLYNRATCTYDLVGGPSPSWGELALEVISKYEAFLKATENAKDPDAKGNALPNLIKQSRMKSLNAAKTNLVDASEAFMKYTPKKNEKETANITRARTIAKMNRK